MEEEEQSIHSEPEEEPQEADANNDSENENLESATQRAVVAVKKKIIKNPQPKFNAERLCGPRGITELLTYHSQLQLRGKGHEKEDLDEVLSILQQWTHRLFPKMPFDASLEQIENLGKKKQTQVHVTKIRMGMPVRDSDFISDEIVQDEPELPMETEEPPPPTNQEDIFEELLRTQRELEEEEAEKRHREAAEELHSEEDDDLTEEQRERMRKNQEMARKRKKKSMMIIDDEDDEQLRDQENTAESDPSTGHPLSDGLQARNLPLISSQTSNNGLSEKMQVDSLDGSTELLEPPNGTATSDDSELLLRLESESEPFAKELDGLFLKNSTKPSPQPVGSSLLHNSDLGIGIKESESQSLLEQVKDSANLSEPTDEDLTSSQNSHLLLQLASESELITKLSQDPEAITASGDSELMLRLESESEPLSNNKLEETPLQDPIKPLQHIDDSETPSNDDELLLRLEESDSEL